MAYDIENLLDDVKTLFQTYLPAKLTAIAAEKGDGLALTKPPNASYFLHRLPDDLIAASPWVVIGIDGPVVCTMAGTTVKRVVPVLVVLGSEKIFAEETLANVDKIFVRYGRGMVEAVASNFSYISGLTILQIEELRYPVAIDEETGETISFPGVRITATFA